MSSTAVLRPVGYFPEARNHVRLLGLAIDPENTRHLSLLMLGFLTFHLMLWTVLPGLSHRSPPWDNIEQIVWTQSMQWGYYKHPPAPTWWMYAWTHLLGRSVWVTFFAAQLSVVFMMACIWRIALKLTTPVRAFTVVMLTSLLAYHGLRGIMANHNTLQLMPVGMLLLASLNAVRSGGWWRWVLVGAAAALCMLSKYSALIWFAALGLWLLQDPRMRSLRAWGSVALALAVCALLMVPHVRWLIQENFPTLAYADKSLLDKAPGEAINHWRELWWFSTAQLARVLPMLLGLWLLRFALRRDENMPVRMDMPARRGDESRFVLILGLGPLVMTFLLGAAGIHLMSSWATTFFVLFGVLVLRWIPNVTPVRLLKMSLLVGFSVEVVLASGLALGAGMLADETGHAARSNFPSAALAGALGKNWRGYIQSPPHVIAGDTWLTGNVSLHMPSQPMVFIDAERERSPWITEAILDSCDVLVLIDRSPDAADASEQTQAWMKAAAVTGTVSLPWTSRLHGPEVKVDWGIVPAKHPACKE